jgi:hypothetical protein
MSNNLNAAQYVVIAIGFIAFALIIVSLIAFFRSLSTKGDASFEDRDAVFKKLSEEYGLTLTTSSPAILLSRGPIGMLFTQPKTKYALRTISGNLHGKNVIVKDTFQSIMPIPFPYGYHVFQISGRGIYYLTYASIDGKEDALRPTILTWQYAAYKQIKSFLDSI